EFNKKPFMEVMEKHKKNLEDVVWDFVPEDLKEAAYKSWERATRLGGVYGFRNAQATVLAPTGTISSLMGCDTTGIEPGTSLVIFKDLAGGGTLTLTNEEVPNALRNLGYNDKQIRDISDYIIEKFNGGVRGTVRGAPHLRPEHYNIFDTAFGNKDEEGAISFEGHIRMLAATQPFISGAISKTNNTPESSTVKDIYDGYILAHKLGLKAVAIFRNNSKPVSALNFGDKSYVTLKRGEKEDLPFRRKAFESEVKIQGVPFHVIVSEYQDGRPGQITFLSFKSGSTLGALLATSGVQASRALKRGVKLEDIAGGWIGQEFNPTGFIEGHPFIKEALSPLDFAGKLLRLEYLGDLSVANLTPETKPEDVIVKLRGFENGFFREYTRSKVDQWDIDQVLKDPELGGFIEEKNPLMITLKKLEIGKNNNERGVTCKECGSIMKQTAPNCFSCPKCPNSIGGCGG
ncbi:MAG: hypothetical protein AABY22_06720, partial [Nanoarchaeota archaeon]